MKDELIRLKNFIHISEEEKTMVLKWRNHKNVKKWMHNSETITFAEHQKFINSLIKTDKKLYFLVLEENKSIGVIYLTNIDYRNKTLEIGLYANPEIRGVGMLLLDLLIQKAFQELKCIQIFVEVYMDNSKALFLYLKKGFIEYKRKVVNNDKELIYMKLTREKLLNNQEN